MSTVFPEEHCFKQTHSRTQLHVLTAHRDILMRDTKRGVLSQPDMQCTRRPPSPGGWDTGMRKNIMLQIHIATVYWLNEFHRTQVVHDLHLTCHHTVTDNRELKQRGRERQRERYKTINLIAEYNHWHVEIQPPGTFRPSSLEMFRTWKPQFSSFIENVTVRIISIFMQL